MLYSSCTHSLAICFTCVILSTQNLLAVWLYEPNPPDFYGKCITSWKHYRYTVLWKRHKIHNVHPYSVCLWKCTRQSMETTSHTAAYTLL